MAYREVTMVEVKEVLRLWLAGGKKKRIAAQLGLDAKTVRRYIAGAERCGLVPKGSSELTDEKLAEVLLALRSSAERLHGDGWQRCLDERAEIETLLGRDLRLSKVRRLLLRRGVDIPYSTLHRFAVSELGFGRAAPTMPVADGKPGEEVQVDTGWMTLLEPDARGRRRRFRAWIFTPSVSRYRFVYPCLEETTASAIEACEAAWEFYQGIFAVVVPDCTKAIVHTADPLAPRLVSVFLEYAQARGFVVDPTRTRSPKDKARVERSVRDVRDDCFAGEVLLTITDARERARHWCAEEYGMRRHSTTLRLPREHFDAVEKPALLPVPTQRYDTPLWAEPKVARDQHAQIARALYSLPRRFVGKTLRARADQNTVRFYDGTVLVKTHVRMPAGARATDAADFPPEKTAYAMRDVAFLERQATEYGVAIGRFAHALLDVPLPWTRMRRVYALLGLVKRYGALRVEQTCARALDADMVDVRRLERMLKLAAPPPAMPSAPARVIPLGRFLRPASDYALPCIRESLNEGDDE
jgi:transposase